MNLTPRLKIIADMVSIGDTIADIGTDHAYLPIYLLENKICPYAIASDVNKGPILNAVSAIKAKKLASLIKTRLSDGLCSYKEREVDAFIIAGMSGLTMIDILQGAHHIAKSVKYLILQPMQGRIQLRIWLCQNGFSIVAERIAIEGDKYYEVIKVISQKMDSISWPQTEIGVNPIIDQNYLRFLRFKIQHKKSILSQLLTTDNEPLIKQYKTQIAVLKEVLQCASIQKKSSVN